MTRPAWLPPWSDLLPAAAFMVLVAAEGIVNGTWVEVGGEELRIESPAIYLAIGMPAMAALAWRRRFPLAVATAVIATNFFISADGKTSTILAVAFACYAVGAHSSRGGVGLAVVISAFFIPWIASSAPLVPSDVAAAMVFIGGPWGAGRFAASRTRAADAAVERAELLERERQALDAASAAEERVRLARELHDVISHSISVVAVQTQAVRRRLRPDQQREADDLVAVETTAREVMAEMRRLFGVLRSDDGATLSLAPQPGLAELDRLVEQVRATGLHVYLDREGDRTPLQPGVDLAAYRIVQEALTNVIKHADADAVTVRVHRAREVLDVIVEDDGRGLRPRGDAPSGNGLVGIRERAEMYGGTLTVDTSPTGGVRVAARLPLTVVSA